MTRAFTTRRMQKDSLLLAPEQTSILSEACSHNWYCIKICGIANEDWALLLITGQTRKKVLATPKMKSGRYSVAQSQLTSPPREAVISTLS